MELAQELFVTAVVAVLFSFLVAKLVSMANVGDSGCGSELKLGTNVGGEEAVVMEELRFGERLNVRGFETEKGLQFVEETVERVDEFDGEEPGRAVEIKETEHVGAGLPGKAMEKCLGEETDIVEQRERSVEEKTVKELEGVVDHKLKDAEFPKKSSEKCLGGDSVIVEQREKPEKEAEGFIAEMAKRADTTDTVEEIGAELALDKGVSEQSEKIDVLQSKSEGGDREKEEKVEFDEDGWEGIERTELEKVFASAATFVGSEENGDLASVGSDVQMELYGLHKVATEGPCHEPPPMALMVSARAKWNAWQKLGNMNPEVAMEQYIALLSDKFPKWIEDKFAVGGKSEAMEVRSTSALSPDLNPFSIKQADSTEHSHPEVEPGAEEIK